MLNTRMFDKCRSRKLWLISVLIFRILRWLKLWTIKLFTNKNRVVSHGSRGMGCVDGIDSGMRNRYLVLLLYRLLSQRFPVVYLRLLVFVRDLRELRSGLYRRDMSAVVKRRWTSLMFKVVWCAGPLILILPMSPVLCVLVRFILIKRL
jgi:hypothetical protein